MRGAGVDGVGGHDIGFVDDSMDRGQLATWLEAGAGGRGGEHVGVGSVGGRRNDDTRDVRRKSVGERVSDFEKLRIQKTSDSDCNTGWRQEDDKIITSLAKGLTKKKWDIIKLCLETIQDISITVKEMKTTELKKMSVDWSEDDARKVER